ncbi:YdeI/OmpD-associated family protein [Hymenobacter chitinivorans]|uniref:Uncharacterized protein YdeI (YjbR/CyaY-like superfamily) n=1 Tax=Hymenobacter chitinivorans DSM 11115 TaxID=1121954 RepID=A0A2M9BSP6_9BACT|nr:DUF1801 domain-containing protein [Hymenobacter chitinivorans]PJJ60976.1 uncharacterized protein YdeI (YjbR/CyaY-like superfamily) [Hymenobacter chitinivorans DSM 11115]
MAPSVDLYFADGCGRCALVATPACSVRKWQPALHALRALALGSGLTEELKWGVPCYTLGTKNVVLIHAFKDYCALNFFNGALLSDPNSLLVQQTPNVQAARQIRFTDAQEILRLESVLHTYIREAIAVEEAGLKVARKPTSDFPLPEELHDALAANAALKAAFHTLTPGRQRGYLLFFAAPKQAKTRAARIEKYTPHILSGKGLHD